jgi:hypothetical protein
MNTKPMRAQARAPISTCSAGFAVALAPIHAAAPSAGATDDEGRPRMAVLRCSDDAPTSAAKMTPMRLHIARADHTLCRSWWTHFVPKMRNAMKFERGGPSLRPTRGLSTRVATTWWRSSVAGHGSR